MTGRMCVCGATLLLHPSEKSVYQSVAVKLLAKEAPQRLQRIVNLVGLQEEWSSSFNF